MRIFSPSPRSTSPTTFLLPLGPSPESIPEDGARVHVPRQAASTSGPTHTGVGGQPVSRASSGAWPDAPMRIPSGRLEGLGSTTTGLATGDASPDPSPDPDPQDAPSDEGTDYQRVVADASGPYRARADRVREQARAAKLQMLAQAETARRAQANASPERAHTLIE